jgi:Na+/citrate or Na+/malate symporter
MNIIRGIITENMRWGTMSTYHFFNISETIWPLTVGRGIASTHLEYAQQKRITH